MAEKHPCKGCADASKGFTPAGAFHKGFEEGQRAHTLYIAILADRNKLSTVVFKKEEIARSYNFKRQTAEDGSVTFTFQRVELPKVADKKKKK